MIYPKSLAIRKGEGTINLTVSHSAPVAALPRPNLEPPRDVKETKDSGPIRNIQGNEYWRINNNPCHQGPSTLFYRHNHSEASNLDNRQQLDKKIQEILETDRNIHPNTSRRKGFKTVGANEPEYNGNPYKIKFKGGIYGSLRIAVGERGPTESEKLLLEAEGYENIRVISPKFSVGK